MRLGFAVATEIDPDILLIDEILAVGDESFQHKCAGRIEEFRRHGKTIVFVSHNLGAVRQICHRALLIDAGVVLADGPVHEVVARYEELLQVNVQLPFQASAS